MVTNLFLTEVNSHSLLIESQIIFGNKSNLNLVQVDCYNLVNTSTGHDGYVTSLLQLSNGMIAPGSSDNTIKIWNPNGDYNLLNTLNGHNSYVLSLLQL